MSNWIKKKLHNLFLSLSRELAETNDSEKEHDSSVYYQAVLDKIIKLKNYSDADFTQSCEGATALDGETKMAKILSDRDQIWEHYFSGIHHDVVQVVEETIEESDILLDSREEKQLGIARAKNRFVRAMGLPMKLFLTPLQSGGSPANAAASFLDMKFGPLHVALQVGQVVLEWDDSSLVAPYHCDHNERLMQVNVELHSKWIDEVADKQGEIVEAAEGLQYKKQVGLLYFMLSKKIEMVHSLIDVIVKYNRFKCYNIITCNCQNFVIDALNALGVVLPKEFTGGLGEYYAALTAGRSPSIPKEFQTHKSLDEYVLRSNLKEMSISDLEFILAMYYRFHLENKDQLRKRNKLREDWECSYPTCCMRQVGDSVDTKSLLIYKTQ